MDIRLNFINNMSNDADNQDIVIFQKNVTTNVDDVAVAWLVIRNCGRGDHHPFTFPIITQVGASDNYGHSTPHFSAQDGQAFAVFPSPAGIQLGGGGRGTSPSEIQVLNKLPSDAINASIYRNGKLLATQRSIAPGQEAAFQFRPTIWIGVMSGIAEGKVMTSDILSDIGTELSLLGVASADIVMTEGGRGPDARPFRFQLDNVVRDAPGLEK